MKWIALTIGSVLCLLEVVVVIAYFKTFNGSISLDNQAWNTFGQVFNGFVMALLTGLNVLIFYKISNSIEENTKNRAVKQTIFEAQLVITQMRVKLYEELSLLINDITVDLYQDNRNEGRIMQLKKILMRIEYSYLFKSKKFKEGSVLSSLSENVLNMIKCGNTEGIVTGLGSLIKIMEIFIFTQMLIGRDVEEYIDKHKGNIDSTFGYVDQLVSDIELANKSSSKYTNEKQ